MTLKHKDLPGSNTQEMFENYVKDFYKFDSEYRCFITAFDRLGDTDPFNSLFEKLEQDYTNSYLNDLSVKWCAIWDGETRWHLSGITSQQGFYDRYIRRYVSDNERVVVIISDGLRYESAVQLNEELNRGQKGKSELDAMLGVIPSYTALGMAALLPHKTIEITSKGDFEINGISTEGTANREKILQTVKKEALAIRAAQIINLNQQQLHEKLSESGNKLIYIYHNTIDARGDNASTENEVFEATEKAFNEIFTLVRKLRTLDLSIQNIVITADHGYIYRRTPLQERDKTPKEDLAGVKSKRRFIIANENLEQQGTQSFPMSYLDKNSDMYAILPRSTNCFKLSGAGSCYVHGGTSLQEVVIPVIRFRSDKKANPSMNTKKVSVSVTSLSHKVTSIVTHLTFFQNEPVDEKHLPIHITAFFEDESGERISSENIIIADSTSKEPQDRAYKEKFTLKNMAYDKGKNYYLVLKDEKESVNQELERIPFVIDLLFGGNIQF